jgi:PKD repeat protein
MRLLSIVCVLLFLSWSHAQEVFPSISGRNASTKESGDNIHQYDFWLKPESNAGTAQVALFDAGLGGIADIISGPADTRTVFELIPFNALYTYENGTLITVTKNSKPTASLTTFNEPQFVNRWFSFAQITPQQNGWILRVRTIGGNDINTYQLQVSDTLSTTTARNDWSIIAVDLSIALIRMSAQSEVQIRPYGGERQFPLSLTVQGQEDSEIGVRDAFGNYSKLPAKKEFFVPTIDRLPNTFGLTIGNSIQRINNLVIKGTTSPVLWDLKPTVVRSPQKPALTAVQLPGAECSSVRFVLSEGTKRNIQNVSPAWNYSGKSYEGDSTEIHFGKPGRYSVTLLVPTRGLYFPKYWMERIPVTVNAPPTARITADKTVISPGEIVTLSASQSVDPEKGVLRYQWFVNGEYRSDESTLQLSSLLPTSYSVTLIVSDGALNSSCTTDDDELTVRINAQPYAEINFPQIFGRSETVTFAVKSVVDNDNDTLSFSWSGKGIVGAKTSSSIKVRHDSAGTYRMTLSANDRTNTVNSSYETVISYRVNAEPILAFAMVSQAAPGDTLVLNAWQTKDADNADLRYTWTSTEGHRITGDIAKVSFKEPGDYSVTLTADDGENVSNSVKSITKKIHINAPPVPVITANARSTAARQRMTGEKTTDADNARLKYFWNFGDGSRDSGKAVTHTYQQSGRYIVTLTVDDLQKQSNSVRSTTHELVINRYPTAEFTIPATWEPFRPLAVNADKSRDPDGEISEYHWLVNGTPVASGMTAELKFSEPGDYAVALKVKDNSGFDDAIGVKTVPIHINYPPVVQWKMIPAVAEPNIPVTFDATSSFDKESKTLKKATWRFSDGTTATGMKATKTFAKPGVVSVAAIVDDESGFSNSSQSHEQTILVNSPPIIVTTTTIRSNSRRILLDASGSYDVDNHALSFSWLLPDKKTVNKASFLWDAPAGGVHFITLTANDGQGKKNSLTRETIKVLVNRPPVAVVDSTIFTCSGQTVLFNGSRSYDPDGDAVSTGWNFGDGTTSTETNPAHAYSKPGFYTVTLQLDDGFADQPTVATIPIIVEGSPIALQNITDTTVCVNVPLEFSGEKSNDPNGPIGSYTWDFGDGITSYGSTVSHAYTKPGTYYVTLTVIGSGSGKCSKVSQATSVVRVIAGPTSRFDMPEYVSVGEAVMFDPAFSEPNGTVTSVRWQIGSDTTMTTSSLTSVSYAFKRSGTYAVTMTLSITSESDCNTAVITKKIQVNEPPVVIMKIPSDIALGDQLILDGSASHDPDGVISSYEWLVDGKTVGTTPVVSIASLSAGRHTVQLSVTDNSGTTTRSVSREMTFRVNAKPDPSFSVSEPLYENELLSLRPEKQSDADGDNLTITWKFGGTTIAPDSIRLTPGRHVITMIANDGRHLKNSVDSVRKEIFVIAAPSLTGTYPRQWIIGTAINSIVLFNSGQINFIVNGMVRPTIVSAHAGATDAVIAWTPRGVALKQQQMNFTIFDSLRFTVVPELKTIEWNPSNPTIVLTAPPVNRAQNTSLTYEWRKGTASIGVGTMIEAKVNKGENFFTLRARDQDVEGAHWTEIKIVVMCE